AAAVDHQDPALAGLAEHRLEQGVVLEAGDRDGPAVEGGHTAVLPQLGVAGTEFLAVFVVEVRGAVHHFPFPGLCRPPAATAAPARPAAVRASTPAAPAPAASSPAALGM